MKSLPEADADQKSAKLTAIAQLETTLQQLEATPPIGRVVIHLPSDVKSIDKMVNTSVDVPLRDGDELVIPKKANYVLVSGQVFNPTAVSYFPGRSAKWYLSQSGGLTQVADKSAVFVVRADGSVLSAKNNSGFWSGDPMGAVLEAGRLDCGAGKGTEGRYSELDPDYAGGAGRSLGCPHCSLHTSVEVGTKS